MERPTPDVPSKCTWQKNAHFATSPHTKVPYFTNKKKILPNVLHAIGNTPLIKLNRIPKSKGLQCEILVKCEFLNPGGSVKDRIALRMIEDAERKGLLKAGSTVIESTAGNTGIGLAMACAVKGYRCIIVMSMKYSNSKADILRALGAEIVRIPAGLEVDLSEGQFQVCREIQKQIPNSIIMQQFRNASNPLAHYDLTASEIYDQCDGKIDMVVLAAATGGTITGVGRKLKELIPNCLIVGADAAGSILSVTGKQNAHKEQPSAVEGIGFPILPTVIDRSIIDSWVKVQDVDAFSIARRLHQEEGILCGGSSGAAVAAGIQAAVALNENQRCVVLLPDGVCNYMKTFIVDQWLEARFLKPCINTHHHWWWDIKVTDLTLKSPTTVQEDITCSKALEIMKQNGCEQIPVTNSKMSLIGMVTVSNVMNLLINCKIELDSSLTKALTKDYRILNLNANLGLVSRILEIEPFLLIVDKNKESITNNVPETEINKIYGVVTKMDLLQFIKDNRDNNNTVSNGYV